MKICIPIKERSLNKAKKLLLEASQKADMAEIWADQLQEGDLELLLSERPCKVLVTVKRTSEKGAFKGSYEAHAARLIQACTLSPDYIEIPLKMPEKMNKKIVQTARKNKVKVLISHHDHRATPSLQVLQGIAQKIMSRKPDIVKISTMARSLDDTVTHAALARLLQSKKQLHCLIAAGKMGRLSRILTPTLGGEMMFASLSKNRQTALGQMTVSELESAWNLINVK